jgi:DNA repair protein RadC
MGTADRVVGNWIETQRNDKRAELIEKVEAAVGWLRVQPIENCQAFFVDSSNNVIDADILWTGNRRESPAFSTEIIRRAIVLRASSIIMLHNHPASSAAPSRADNHFTAELLRLAGAVEITLWDHIIVAPAGRYSYRADGKLERSSLTTGKLSAQAFARHSLACAVVRTRFARPLGAALEGGGWLILLALFRDMRAISPKELAMMTCMSVSTVLRYVAILRREQQLVVGADGSTGRIRTIEISVSGSETVEQIIALSQ